MSCEDAIATRKKLSVLSYKYFYNGFYLHLFSLSEIQRPKELINYEKKVKVMLGVNINKF